MKPFNQFKMSDLPLKYREWYFRKLILVGLGSFFGLFPVSISILSSSDNIFQRIHENFEALGSWVVVICGIIVLASTYIVASAAYELYKISYEAETRWSLKQKFNDNVLL